MKPGIHPDYVETTVTCCLRRPRSPRAAPRRTALIHVDVCSQCHPFYTGKQKILDTGGRVARFEQRYGKRPQPAPADGRQVATSRRRPRRLRGTAGAVGMSVDRRRTESDERTAATSGCRRCSPSTPSWRRRLADPAVHADQARPGGSAGGTRS